MYLSSELSFINNQNEHQNLPTNFHSKELIKLSVEHKFGFPYTTFKYNKLNIKLKIHVFIL